MERECKEYGTKGTEGMETEKSHRYADRFLLIAVATILGIAMVANGERGLAGHRNDSREFSPVHVRSDCERLCDRMDSCLLGRAGVSYRKNRDLLRDGCPRACSKHYGALRKCVPGETPGEGGLSEKDLCSETFQCMAEHLAGAVHFSLPIR